MLPGLIVPAGTSSPTMQVGVTVLSERGPGGARLEMAQHPLPISTSEALAEHVRALGTPVIVRSSSLLEGNGEWAGAFESFKAVRPQDVEPAVRSCWASAFMTSTLMRAEAAGIRPGSVPMAILVQPFIEPDCGGTATAIPGGVDIQVAQGSPALLFDGVDDGRSHVALLTEELTARISDLVREVDEKLGATSFEWALVGDDLYILQLKRAIRRVPEPAAIAPGLDTPLARRVAAVIRRAPGPIGRRLVLPWAIGAGPETLDDPDIPSATDVGPLKAFEQAGDLARSLTAEVWDRARPIAWDTATQALEALAGSDPRAALEQIAQLRPPEAEGARHLLGLVARVRDALTTLRSGHHASESWHIEIATATAILSGVPSDAVAGIDDLESFDTAVIVSQGHAESGLSAAPGMRSGRACFIADPADLSCYQPRDVVVAAAPVRDLAPLLWTASGLVTGGGARAAHLFEVAQARNIPAVCGVDLDRIDHDGDARSALCVDGFSGTVYSIDW